MANLHIRNLSKSFGASAVLDDVTLDIRDGEFLTLVGPSGCGKTTLLRIIAGLDHADRGTVAIDDQPVDDMPPKRRDVAMVFQSYALYPYMTVAENMALPLVMRQLSTWQRVPVLGRWWPGGSARRAAIQREVASVADSLGLAALLDRRPGQLSGGQRQRVALGRAMVRRPKVFLMDEPLSNLDAKLRVATRAEIAELHRRLATTFVYVTHDQVEAMTMSDRVALMMEGRILQLATPQQIYDDPVDLRVAEFIGTPKINVLTAVRRDGLVWVGEHPWPVQADTPDGSSLSLAVRPEAWTVVLGEVPPSRDLDAMVSAQVRHLEALGSETFVHVLVDGQPEPLVARVEPERARGLQIGQAVTLSVHPARVLAFDARGRRLPARAAAPQRAWEDEVAHG